MQYHGKEVVVLLAMLISLLASSFPLLQILAQTNGSVGLLVTDAIDDLQEGNIEAALVHVNLARQEISPNDNGSTFAVLLDDVINDLEEKDTKKALLHLDLAQRHLGSPIRSPSEQQKSPKIIDSNQPTSMSSNDTSANYNETQYYCTSEGCGYYQYEVCLDCDEDGDGFPDELFDPRNPSFEGCDDPGLVCSDQPGFQIAQGEILHPSFALNATGFSASEIPGYYNEINYYGNQTFDNATSYFTNGSSTGMIQRTNESNFPVSSQQNRINWLEMCLNPLVDFVINEPCSTLTTTDGYILTPEGERVLRCLAGGALVGILAPELLIEIRELGPAVGCGVPNNTSGTSSRGVVNASNNGSVNPIIVAMIPGSAASTNGQGYEPGEVTVARGATIIWNNQDSSLHTATSGNPATATPDLRFDTGLVGANQQSKPVTMPTQPGEYSYFCTLHPFLVGSVTVQ